MENDGEHIIIKFRVCHSYYPIAASSKDEGYACFLYPSSHESLSPYLNLFAVLGNLDENSPVSIIFQQVKEVISCYLEPILHAYLSFEASLP